MEHALDDLHITSHRVAGSDFMADLGSSSHLQETLLLVVYPSALCCLSSLPEASSGIWGFNIYMKKLCVIVLMLCHYGVFIGFVTSVLYQGRGGG